MEREGGSLSAEREKLSSELKSVVGKISAVESGRAAEGEGKIEELRILEQKINSLRGKKNDLERQVGRMEGMIESKENKVKISGRCPLCGSEIKETDPVQEEKKQKEEKELVELKNSLSSILDDLRKMGEEEKEGVKLAETRRGEINKEMEVLRDLEREKFSFKVRQQELSSALEMVEIKEKNLQNRREAFENELKEGAALIGAGILEYKNYKLEEKSGENIQEELKKKIERIKIKLEDAGLGSGAELMKEYKEVSERDQFLAKEMDDLDASVKSLQKLIMDLKEKIDVEFKEGVKKINVEFQEFFTLLFGGGHGSLSVIEIKKRKSAESDEEEMEEDEAGELEGEEEMVVEKGIEINVSLPHKKVKELNAFSGGERSLTSIALLFAMSQVNPPPFLVLDETDAALDEANSRKYGDMLQKLSKQSQLIVVTHNRETMSRAGVLYGVTIGGDEASKLLSVQFEEATQIAK